MVDNCVDCGTPANPCAGASGIGLDCVVTSCMSSLGITKDMALCVVISQLATAICTPAITTCYGNTLFVSTCGNDATAQRTNILKPFSTIAGALEKAQSGDLIYVYAGTYNIIVPMNKLVDGTEVVGVNYYLCPGVIVNGGSGSVLSSSVTAGTVTIDGYGVLTSTFDTVVTSLVAITYDIHCKSINSTGASHVPISFNSGTLYLNFTTITSLGGSCIDVRTGATTGYVTGDLLDASASALGLSAVRFKDVTATGAKWIFKVALAKSGISSGGLFSTITMDTGNTGTPEVYYQGNLEFAPASTGTYNGGITVYSGNLEYQGVIKNTSAFGCGAVSVSGTLTIKNSRIRVTGSTSSAISFPTAANGICILENTDLVSNASAAGRATVIFYSGTPNPTFQANNCRIKNEDTTGINACISMNTAQAGLTPTLILDSCYLFSSSATGVPLHTTVASNTRLTNCWANLANGGGGVFTDLVQAMNIDAQLLFYIQ